MEKYMNFMKTHWKINSAKIFYFSNWIINIIFYTVGLNHDYEKKEGLFLDNNYSMKWSRVFCMVDSWYITLMGEIFRDTRKGEIFRDTRNFRKFMICSLFYLNPFIFLFLIFIIFFHLVLTNFSQFLFLRTDDIEQEH